MRKKGDIVLAPFPFSDLVNAKLRPSVIVAHTSDIHADLIVAAVSSVIPALLGSKEFIVKSGSLNKLRVASVIKVDRIATIREKDVVADLGCLSISELKLFQKIFKSIVD